jgi:hypothetical protein
MGMTIKWRQSTHVELYKWHAGFPATLNGLLAAKEVFDERERKDER